uniref:Uncharacterized protein n=1 Tax=Arundo donax TaxID=35708 RepID=A0A0A9FQR0_ARUDO
MKSPRFLLSTAWPVTKRYLHQIRFMPEQNHKFKI